MGVHLNGEHHASAWPLIDTSTGTLHHDDEEAIDLYAERSRTTCMLYTTSVRTGKARNAKHCHNEVLREHYALSLSGKSKTKGLW